MAFRPAPYVTCLDLGPAGALYTSGWDRSVELTERAAKKVKQTINQVWIYPPTDDAGALLEQADPLGSFPTTVPAAELATEGLN